MAGQPAARTGRRPGKHDTRAEVLAAARQCFAGAGYDGTTMRQVAAAAGVDAAMVHRHFGTKQALFLAAVGLPRDLTDVLAVALPGDAAGVGERVVRAFVDLWDLAPLQGASFAGLLRLATSDPAGAAALREYLQQTVGGALSQMLGDPAPSQRIGLVGSQLLGIAVTRYVLRLEPLASASPDEVAAQLGWIVQRLITNYTPDPGSL
ncbi:TetR/AcrR family transcriptional regulator [Flindersiella endophytica]